MAVTLTSCFTAGLLNDKNKPSYIANDSYSFNRAYYCSDSILHIDLMNDNSKRRKTRYYSIALNVNAVLQQYFKQGDETVYFNNKTARQYRAISACAMIKSCSCTEALHYGNTVLIDFKDTRVIYLDALPPVNKSSLAKPLGLVGTYCCWQPQTNENYDDGDDDNSAVVDNVTPIYIIPIASDGAGDSSMPRFVAIRMRLKNRRTKLALVPLTVLLDVVTSPIQLGVLLLTKKADDNDGQINKGQKTITPKGTTNKKKQNP